MKVYRSCKERVVIANTQTENVKWLFVGFAAQKMAAIIPLGAKIFEYNRYISALTTCHEDT